MATKDLDNEIKLYTILIDQFTKYNSIIWQIPTALFAANILVIKIISDMPIVGLAIFTFNWTILFAFHRMILQQRQIIEAMKKAEKKLKIDYPDFFAVFKSLKIRSPKVTVWVLSLLNVTLLTYTLFLVIDRYLIVELY